MESQRVKLIVDLGNDHNAEVNTTVPKGTEVVYFTGIFAGAVKGMADASTFLTDLLPDDIPEDLQTQAAAGKSAAKIFGG